MIQDSMGEFVCQVAPLAKRVVGIVVDDEPGRALEHRDRVELAASAVPQKRNSIGCLTPKRRKRLDGDGQVLCQSKRA